MMKKIALAAMLAIGSASAALAATQGEIDGLARNVERAEAIRAVKNVQRGFAQLYNLDGGISAWTRAGLQLTA